jgi:hypothetical protein
MLNRTLVAVSAAGLIAFTKGFDPQDRLITIADTLGHVLYRFGKQGNGPGELGHGVFALSFYDSTIATFGISPPRFVLLRLDGREINTTRGVALGIPVAINGDSADFLNLPSPMSGSAPSTSIRRMSLQTLASRILIDTADAAFRQIAIAPSDSVGQSHLIVFATNGPSFAVANPRTQMVQVFGSDGAKHYALRDTGPILHMHLDVLERLWIVGRSPSASDSGSTSLALFANGRQLATYSLRCEHPYGSSLALPFLALLCEVQAGSDAELELKLFRIHE